MVSLNHTRVLPSGVVSRCVSGPFEIAIRPSSTVRSTVNTAFMSGSSKHGNALRQSVDCIWVVAMTRSMPLSSTNVLRYQPRSLSFSTPVKVMAIETSPGATSARMTRRSVSSCRWNPHDSPFTVTAWICSSFAFTAISSVASTHSHAMTTVPVKLAVIRSGVSDSS